MVAVVDLGLHVVVELALAALGPARVALVPLLLAVADVRENGAGGADVFPRCKRSFYSRSSKGQVVSDLRPDSALRWQTYSR